MNKDNLDQISDWNGAVGRQWAALQLDLDAMIKPFGDAALVVAAAKPGQGVIDIGCGCGDTSIALAREVGQLGSVLGIDVSLPMLEVARVRAATAQLPNLDFSHADASTAELPAGIDLLYSRFGVMFFNQPASALRHMRKALVSGGRIVFACWRTPRDNPWAMAPHCSKASTRCSLEAPAASVGQQPAGRPLRDGSRTDQGDLPLRLRA